jgi:predicted nucleotide-binding protein
MPSLQANPVRKDTVSWHQSSGRRGELEVEFVIGHMRRRHAIDWIRSVALSRDDLDWLKPAGDQWFLDLDKVNARFPGLLANEPWAKGVHAVTPEVRDEEPMKDAWITIVEFCVEGQTPTATAAARHDQPLTRRVFIGHGRSRLWRDLKDFLHERLHLDFEEFNRESAAGLSTKERLLQMLDASSFAFLIMTAEDERSDGSMTARANVIHEVGLFQGRLGFERAVVLIEEGCEEFSNILGVTQIRFPKGALDTKYEEIRKVLEREGILDERQT